MTVFTDNKETDLYSNLLYETLKRENIDLNDASSKFIEEMDKKNLILSVAYKELVNELDAEKNIIKYFLSKTNKYDNSDINLTQSELFEIFNFLVLCTNVKVQEVLENRKKSNHFPNGVPRGMYRKVEEIPNKTYKHRLSKGMHNKKKEDSNNGE